MPVTAEHRAMAPATRRGVHGGYCPRGFSGPDGGRRERIVRLVGAPVGVVHDPPVAGFEGDGRPARKVSRR